MTEDNHRLWDIIFKWFGLVAVLASAWWTVYKYRQDRMVDLDHQKRSAEDLENARKNELNSYIFQNQAKLYFDATRAAATLATSRDPKELKDARGRFNQLYYGELVVVEDRRVELAMIVFGNCINGNGRDCVRSNTDKNDNPVLPEKLARYGPPTLRNLSLELAACMRSALQDDRDIQFGTKEFGTTTCPYDGKQLDASMPSVQSPASQAPQ